MRTAGGEPVSSASARGHAPLPPASAAPSPAAATSRLAVAALVATTALLLHLAAGYRPVPSLDDFAYLPVFRHAADPSLYASDTMLREMSLHSLGWQWVFSLSDATVGVARGFWIATMLLSVATVTAALRIATTLGMRAAMLPLAGLLVFASKLNGVGRGAYDGAFGAGFHGQWLALCLLLFAYDAFTRRQAARTGVFLGLVALAHVSVAIHGAVVVTIATLLSPAPRWKPLVTTAAVAFVVSLPALVPMVTHLTGAGETAWTAQRIIEDGYRFRLTHEYDLDIGRTGYFAALLLVLAAGAGAHFLWQDGRAAALRRVLALAAGHAVLVVLAVIFYAGFPLASVLPYLLSLTRTSPLLVVLLGIVAVAGLDAFVRRPSSAVPYHLLAGVALTLAIAFELRMFVTWSDGALALLALCAASFALLETGVAHRRIRTAIAATGLALAAAACLATAVRTDSIDAAVPAEAAELYAWVRASTPPDAMFIVPPGFEAFRWFAERPAYVDFKLFPPASIESIATWRQRLEDVAAPDRQALALDGWRAARDFDRCYAARNTPPRIAELLARTGATYLVWDGDGLRIPPLTGSDRSDDPRVGEVFRNARFTVYRLHQASRDA